MARCIVDGELDRDTIQIFDDGLLRGDGVFEVVRLYRGQPWALAEHLDRMALSARNLHLDLSISTMTSEVEQLLASIPEEDAFLRLVATRGGRRIAIIEPIEEGPPNVRLIPTLHTPSPVLRDIKSLSYAANMLAARLALEQGGNDALFVTADGRVLEATRATLFYVLNGALYTPPLGVDILNSITRRHLVALLDVRERVTSLHDLFIATEAFIASTTKEVLAVSGIANHNFDSVDGQATRHAESTLLTKIYEDLGLGARG